MENKVVELESEVADANIKLNDLKMVSLSKQAVSSDMHFLEDQVAQLQKQIEHLEEKNCDLENDLKEKQSNIVELNGNVNALKKDLKDKTEGYDSLSAHSLRLK